MIEIRDLTKAFGSHRALDHVSLDVRSGEFIALLGPSGCGKTTLLRSIAGFVDPDSGTIAIDGQPMRRVPPNRRPVNTVFQNYALFPHYSVADNVAFGPRRRGLSRAAVTERVKEALAVVGMAGFEERFPSQLSGGQQQRVALARAIVNRPKVLLLDEPLGALDLKLRKQLQMELSKLHKTLQITFLFVTHDQEEALALADRVAVMRKGVIVQLGTPAEVYRQPASRYVADFVGESTILACRRNEDGSVVLETNGAPLPARLADAWQDGQALLVRPENIALGRAPSPDHMEVQGMLAASAFLGSLVRIHLQLGGGEMVVVDTDGSEPPPAAGEACHAHWPAARCTLVGA